MGVTAQIFVRTCQPMTPEFVEEVRYRMCDAFGAQRFAQWGVSQRTPALEIVPEVEQDGPLIKPIPGETLIRCHASTSYYAPGYERGDPCFLILLARYLEESIPGAEVWYGSDSDSSGGEAQRFGPDERQVLWEHFVAHGHRPYGDYFGRHLDQDVVPKCTFCAGKPMRYYGEEEGVRYFTCPGCSANVEGRGTVFQNRTDRIEPGLGAVDLGFDLQQLTAVQRNTLLGLLTACVKNPQDKSVHLVLNDWIRDRGIALPESEDVRAIQVRESKRG